MSDERSLQALEQSVLRDALARRKWQGRFLALAEHIAGWSKDPSTKVGAVIVQGKQIVSLGFNGFPMGMSDDPALYEDREQKYARVIHAEVNALLFADRAALKGASLYTWPLACCERCVVQMIQAGITDFYFPTLDTSDLIARWGKSIARSKEFIAEAGARWHEVPRG